LPQTSTTLNCRTPLPPGVALDLDCVGVAGFLYRFAMGRFRS
jgi:hypothetical protein